MSIQHTVTIEAEGLISDLFQSAIRRAERRSDSNIYRGLDQKIVDYLRPMVDKDPDLRDALASAADLRSANAHRLGNLAPSSVYFIQNTTTGSVKIGSATNPEGRLDTLQTGSDSRLVLLGVIDGGQRAERQLHVRFSHLRIRGEWFEPSSELMSFIDGVAR